MTDYLIERNGRKCRVKLAGEFVASVVPDLKTAMQTELQAGVDELEFDLRDTPMLDSSAIGLLIAACNSLARQGASLRVVNVSPEILQMLQSMRLVSRLNVTGRETILQTHG
jgi:anti-anti-sigma factor